MKYKSLLMLVIASIMIIAAGCGTAKEKDTGSQNQEPPAMIEVALKINPENPEPNKEATISATVTQADEKVDDADEVTFEIWKDGQEKHDKIPGEKKGDGVYSIKKSFSEAGKYFVISHVTARDMHNMPQKEFTVGDVKADDTQAKSSDHHDDSQASGHDDHHDAAGVSMHFTADDQIKAKEKTTLSVHLQKDNAPFGGARVRFEVWKGNEKKHQFIETKESKTGEYEAETDFSSSGEYSVKVHVEKEEVHTHEVHTITVH
ncbi:FixH family protein [Neobacillus mesonae]|uniref:FixH family protein n=1 Tax=Neobacillus mesonae TaxID=1193713 RepID=UPI00203F4617|nr:FixH family protein [Neobacillus mesonae]MCM3570535.1 FixH family protein [Neobacillus mesonae]